MKSVNPHTGIETLHEKMDRDTAFNVAESLAAEWKQTPLTDRATLFKRLAQLLRDRVDECASMITSEMGMPVAFAKKSVEKCAWTCEYYADNLQFYADEPVDADGDKHYVRYEPLGTIMLVMPWNFPFWQVFRIAVPTILGGNTALLKHSRTTTGCALLIEQLFTDAGFPSVLRTVVTSHDVIADLIASDHVQGVSLTGSVNAGKKVAALAGSCMKPVVMELGGSDPLLVLEDADVHRAATAIVRGRLYNSGQVCISPKRIIIVDAVYDKTMALIREELSNITVGDPMQDNYMGPMSSNAALRDVQDMCERANVNVEVDGLYMQPVLVEVGADHLFAREEVFGPVITVLRAVDEQDAVRIANDNQFGLGASVWTQDLARGERVCHQLEAGATFVNQLVKTDARLPVGGIKDSGVGRELGRHVIYTFSNVKTVNVYK